MDMKDKVNELGRKRASTLDSERPHAVDRQKALGKLTARQRLELLCDPGSFLEFGQLAEASNIKDRESPADGVILGVGRVQGRRTAVVSYDFTVRGGDLYWCNKNPKKIMKGG